MRAEEESGEKRSLCRKSVSFLQKTLALGLWIEYNQSEPDFGQRRPQGVFHTLADAFLLPAEGGPYHAVEYEATGGSLLLFPAVVRELTPNVSLPAVIDGAAIQRNNRKKGVLNNVYGIGLFRHGSFP